MRFKPRDAAIIAIVVAVISYFITGSFLGSIILSVLILFLIGFIARSISGRRSSQKGTASMRVDVFPQNDRSGGSALLKWKGIGNSVTVGKFVINDPMTYFSDGIPIEDEASCIDTTLPIEDSESEPLEKLDYYPSYFKMYPHQRAYYLKWLIGGRKDPLREISYPFVFFYGLERRILIDRVADEERKKPIIEEIIRLLSLYTSSNSFDSYLSRFLAYNVACPSIGQSLSEELFTKIFERSRIQFDDDVLSVALAWIITNKRPLPVKLAITFLQRDPRSPKSVVIERNSEKFYELFRQRYRNQFGDGFAIKVMKKELRPLRIIKYSPANYSESFRYQFNQFSPLVRVPDVLRMRDKYIPIVVLWKTCIQDLK